MSVGFKIKKLREESNLSQSKLADLLGVSQSELSKIENGKSKKIDIYFMFEICNYFNKSLDFFSVKKPYSTTDSDFNIDASSNIIFEEIKKLIHENKKKEEIIKYLTNRV